jgi:hypothetical protein
MNRGQQPDKAGHQNELFVRLKTARILIPSQTTPKVITEAFFFQSHHTDKVTEFQRFMFNMNVAYRIVDAANRVQNLIETECEPNTILTFPNNIRYT